MINFKFPKRKDIRIIEQVYPKPAAQDIADKALGGVIGGIARVLSRKKSEWQLVEHFVKYEPFWHIMGEGFFEYMRRAQYQFEVRPEVRTVTIHRKTVAIDGSNPVCVLQGEEHCFEKCEQEKLVSAFAGGKTEEDLRPYLQAKFKQVRDLKVLEKGDIDIVPVSVRASALVTDMVKQLLKPVQADKVIEERIGITKLALYYRPIHVFNYKDTGSGKMKTVEVDAVTSEAHKPSMLVQRIKGARPSEAALFDAGLGLADLIVPGAGLISKGIVKYTHRRKIKKQMESSKQAAAEKM